MTIQVVTKSGGVMTWDFKLHAAIDLMVEALKLNITDWAEIRVIIKNGE